jgi:hypothetical protein
MQGNSLNSCKIFEFIYLYKQVFVGLEIRLFVTATVYVNEIKRIPQRPDKKYKC